MNLRIATADDVEAMTAIHARAFDPPWSAQEIGGLLIGPGGFAILAEDAGFILCRGVADEAEILTLAVDPAARRQGIGKALVEAAAGMARTLGADLLYLEVAADNQGAILLYEKTHFAWAGLRKGYYARQTGAMDAIVMRRVLNTRK